MQTPSTDQKCLWNKSCTCRFPTAVGYNSRADPTESCRCLKNSVSRIPGIAGKHMRSACETKRAKMATAECEGGVTSKTFGTIKRNIRRVYLIHGAAIEAQNARHLLCLGLFILFPQWIGHTNKIKSAEFPC